MELEFFLPDLGGGLRFKNSERTKPAPITTAPIKICKVHPWYQGSDLLGGSGIDYILEVTSSLEVVKLTKRAEPITPPICCRVVIMAEPEA